MRSSARDARFLFEQLHHAASGDDAHQLGGQGRAFHLGTPGQIPDQRGVVIQLQLIALLESPGDPSAKSTSAAVRPWGMLCLIVTDRGT